MRVRVTKEEYIKIENSFIGTSQYLYPDFIVFDAEPIQEKKEEECGVPMSSSSTCTYPKGKCPRHPLPKQKIEELFSGCSGNYSNDGRRKLLEDKVDEIIRHINSQIS